MKWAGHMMSLKSGQLVKLTKTNPLHSLHMCLLVMCTSPGTSTIITSHNNPFIALLVDGQFIWAAKQHMATSALDPSSQKVDNAAG